MLGSWEQCISIDYNKLSVDSRRPQSWSFEDNIRWGYDLPLMTPPRIRRSRSQPRNDNDPGQSSQDANPFDYNLILHTLERLPWHVSYFTNPFTLLSLFTMVWYYELLRQRPTSVWYIPMILVIFLLWYPPRSTIQKSRRRAVVCIDRDVCPPTQESLDTTELDNLHRMWHGHLSWTICWNGESRDANATQARRARHRCDGATARFASS